MRIFIPTRGRWASQLTLENLTKFGEIDYQITLVVREDEVDKYAWEDKLVVPNDMPLHEKRLFILRQDTRVLMMDDDLSFSERITDTYAPQITSLAKTNEMLHRQEKLLDEYAHTSMAMRQFINDKPRGVRETYKSCRVLGFQTDVVLAEGVKFCPDDWVGPFPMDDYHMTLSLLELGYPNAVDHEFCTGAPGAGERPGGLTGIRTADLQSLSAKKLAELHPESVTLRSKVAETAFDGQEHLDVTIRWGRALGVKANG
jgi:hypothetical protein